MSSTAYECDSVDGRGHTPLRVSHLIDPLWAALESDVDLVTEQETDLIDARLAIWQRKETECLTWESAIAYITSNR